MSKIIYVEDHVVPQLFTTAMEAYEIKHQNHIRGKAYDKLETFGLLWGHSIPSRGFQRPRIITNMVTVETSALRHEDWVKPNLQSIKNKKVFFERYWPNIELVGSFHSHPYNSLSTVNDEKGWRASEGDKEFWTHFHKEVSPEHECLAHLIITITKLNRNGWAYPDRLQGSEYKKGYLLSSEERKFWLRSYASNKISIEDKEQFTFSDDMDLEIPALQRRFMTLPDLA